MIDDSFGHWLAGFTDGEGTFVLTRVTSKKGNPNAKTWPSPRFTIALRADDRHVLEMIRDTLGFGTISAHDGSSAARPNAKPAVRFAVWRIADCLALVRLFEQFPLRAKKRHQFTLWAAGVREVARGFPRDDAAIDELRAALALARVYDHGALEGWEQRRHPRLVHRIDKGDPPTCRCGCGLHTAPVSNAKHVPHPVNPAYASFRRGHGRRASRPADSH